jgi:cellobiose phosphorylase
VTILNPGREGRGVRSIAVDGTPLDGNVIAPHADGRTHRVEVVLGGPSSAKEDK